MRAGHWFLGPVVLATILPLSCGGGSNHDSSFDAATEAGQSSSSSGAGDATGSTGDTSFQFESGTSGGSSGAPSDAQGILTISPGVQTVSVAVGQAPTTVAFTVTLNGVPVNAGWKVDRGDVGTITLGPSSAATLTPTGRTGGLIKVTAVFNGVTGTAQVFVKLTASQSGASACAAAGGDAGSCPEALQVPTAVAQLTAGGGVGGVGGEGLGAAVTGSATLAALGSPSDNGSSLGLHWLYPYDKTVWPRGMLAPLLMWSWTPGDADAIQISLTTTSGSFTWTGTFLRPAILSQTGHPFVRHPIPQDIWEMATDTAGGPTLSGKPDQLTVSLTLAKAGMIDGSPAEIGYGPLTETWTVAAGRLPGIIYYNSYGTQLAQNLTGAVGGNGSFGGAVLSIHVGDTAPQLAAGTSGGTSACRTCHSVAAQGSRLVAVHGDNGYGTSSAYDLTPAGNVEHVMSNLATFPGVFPDGSMALTEGGQILPLPTGANPPTVTGLSSVATDLGTPAFSPDGKLVAFNVMAGSIPTPAQQLWVMAFNSSTLAFTSPTLVADDTGQPATTRPGWPAFLPDGKSLVFHHQSVAGGDGNGSGQLPTRKGAKAQIAWTSATDAAHVTPLDNLNGKDSTGAVYLPKLASSVTMSCTGDGQQVGTIDADHGDDVDLNYEPTVNPLASGGYAWIVFTSRRMYGNESFIPPFCSDPRGVDLIQNITPKKLWVSAIDLGAKAGTDASHPAFYLPAQELLAGNSRGFWVQEPCRKDGQGCQSGDQCCNGYCEPSGDGGALICANTLPPNSCSKLGEKCTSAASCCDTTNQCINGYCAQSTQQPQ